MSPIAMDHAPAIVIELRAFATIISNDALCGVGHLTIDTLERLWQPLQIWLMARNDDSDVSHFSSCKNLHAGKWLRPIPAFRLIKLIMVCKCVLMPTMSINALHDDLDITSQRRVIILNRQ
jgi:hypothetical protein